MKNLMAFVIALALPAGAVAAECSVDADCPVGFACQEVTSTCASSCTPCACACSSGDAGCEPCDCPPCVPEACEPIVTHECVFSPKSCTADAECGEGFACKPVEVCSGGGSSCACTTCACPACADGMECEPCDCADVPVCECPEPEPASCKVEGSWCQVQVIECAADADCPEGFKCESGGGNDCACTCACPPCADGMECPACECPPCECGEPVAYCLPAGWANLGYSTPESGEVQFKDGDATSAAGGDGDVAATDSGTATPPMSADASAAGGGGDTVANESAAPGASDGPGGCLAGAGAPAGSLALSLLPLLALIRRRRA